MADSEKGPAQIIVEFEKVKHDQHPSSWALFNYADALRIVGRTRDAATVYDSLDISSVPKTKQWLVPLYRGVLHQAIGNYSEAESSFRKAISGNPTSTVPWVYLASALAIQEKFEDAIAVLRGAEGLDGDPDEVCLNMAYCFRTLGRLAEAREYLLRALAISPDYDKARAALDDVSAAIAASSA